MLRKNPAERRTFGECKEFLEASFKFKLEFPIIANPREAHKYLMENIGLKEELMDQNSSNRKPIIKLDG